MNQTFEQILESYHVTLEDNRRDESIKLAAEKYAEDVAVKFAEWHQDNYIGAEGVWHTYNDHPKEKYEIEYRTTKDLFTYFKNNIYGKQ